MRSIALKKHLKFAPMGAGPRACPKPACAHRRAPTGGCPYCYGRRSDVENCMTVSETSRPVDILPRIAMLETREKGGGPMIIFGISEVTEA